MSSLCLALQAELARPGHFDEGVEAARNACVCGASLAAAAITAAAYYDNPITGLPALRACMERLAALPLESSAVDVWRVALRPDVLAPGGTQPFTPGFGHATPPQAAEALAGCRRLAAAEPTALRCAFVAELHAALSAIAGPLNATGLAALALLDAGVDLDAAERLYLSWRIAGTLAEAQRARSAGVGAFPFLSEGYVYEGALPAQRTFDYEELLTRVGITGDDD
ncbi:MAG: hypothetical protein RL033_4016 [Pseudomonadota bacterium]